MTKNPFVNSLCAIAYIVLVATFMFYGTRAIGPVDSLIMPVAMISLFTLSAAVMGYIFLLEPLQMYLDGNKKEAVKLFANTVGIFAVITLAVLIIMVAVF